jgi:hypothetical protein
MNAMNHNDATRGRFITFEGIDGALFSFWV